MLYLQDFYIQYGVLGQARTVDFPFRRGILYPTELREQIFPILLGFLSFFKHHPLLRRRSLYPTELRGQHIHYIKKNIRHKALWLNF